MPDQQNTMSDVLVSQSSESNSRYAAVAPSGTMAVTCRAAASSAAGRICHSRSGHSPRSTVTARLALRTGRSSPNAALMRLPLTCGGEMLTKGKPPASCAWKNCSISRACSAAGIWPCGHRTFMHNWRGPEVKAADFCQTGGQNAKSLVPLSQSMGIFTRGRTDDGSKLSRQKSC